MKDARYRILTAMSLVHDAFSRDIIPERLKRRFLRTYNKLQQLRDDEIFIGVEVDLNDDFLSHQKTDRINELCKTPFNLKIDLANQIENLAQ